MIYQGKTALITGATSGIGKVAAMELARRGYTVLIHGRNALKAEAAKAEIVRKTGNTQVEVYLGDLTLMVDVRQLAQAVASRHPRLDVLINNAGGVLGERREVTLEGNEKTLALNVLAPFLLTALLMPQLQAAPEGRIVNVSSAAHQMARDDFENLQLLHGYGPMRAYGNAKLYVILMTQELDRRLKAAGVSNVRVNALHPGVVATNFSLETDSWYRPIFTLLKPFLLTPEQGADTILYLADAPDAAGQSGGYYVKRKRRQPRQTYVTPSNAARLWGALEQLTGQRVLS